ncbi:extracellular solute-binding protein [Massilia sp. TWP1-3-3]|uniref:extracellular solute-binding protein n=1 Tax=Massilia sp. TWP1-3-3 TaxID=2804573 RepID=UPI003CEEAB1A
MAALNWRRCAIAPACRLFAAVAFALGCVLPAHAGQTLRVLTWPGYADPDLVKRFEQENDVRVQVSYVGSDEALRKHLASNGSINYDVFAANTAEMQFYIQHGVAVPLQLSNIPNRARQLPRFRDLQRVPGISRAGQVFAVAYTYAEMGLIYDRKQFSAPPVSLSAMWDPKYQGKVLAFDTSGHNFSIAALVMHANPFHLDEAQFRQSVAKLVALRRNVLTFYTLPEESVELFRRHSVALMFANYGRQQVKLLRNAGVDVGYVIPREGALAWLDCWAVTRGAANKALAERWINFMLDSKVSAELTRRQGLANTLAAGAATRDSDKLIWLEPVEDDQRRAAYWARILSGDVPEKL